MFWLRQQKKVERLSAEAEQNAEQMQQLRECLVERLRTRLQQPGTLAWAFAAGALVGGTKSQQQKQDGYSMMHYLNGAVIALKFLSDHLPDQPSATTAGPDQ